MVQFGIAEAISYNCRLSVWGFSLVSRCPPEVSALSEWRRLLAQKRQDALRVGDTERVQGGFGRASRS